MKIVPLLLLVALGLGPTLASAAGRDRFAHGFAAYQTNGVDALVNVWSLDQSKSAQTKATREFRAAAEGLGEVLDFEVLTSVRISERVERWFGVINHRRGPLWVWADHYVGRQEEGFVAFEMSAHVDEILPRELLVPALDQDVPGS